MVDVPAEESLKARTQEPTTIEAGRARVIETIGSEIPLEHIAREVEGAAAEAKRTWEREAQIISDEQQRAVQWTRSIRNPAALA